eukprot:gnl/TRDRNA2_/TRDRNA2_144664_c0_seq1.p1 gnl/TRDRNA2_/TRDRNA2_144664_c0~~gnl/TRDRNA2_/TRDRNA2_144664_c0_seq1.p1  ORF type:complete len:151 (+),score=13.57 gnl/TRDRNA2_/TRDRNA2_144664_c0_seq1:37-453(+)
MADASVSDFLPPSFVPPSPATTTNASEFGMRSCTNTEASDQLFDHTRSSLAVRRAEALRDAANANSPQQSTLGRAFTPVQQLRASLRWEMTSPALPGEMEDLEAEIERLALPATPSVVRPIPLEHAPLPPGSPVFMTS